VAGCHAGPATPDAAPARARPPDPAHAAPPVAGASVRDAPPAARAAEAPRFVGSAVCLSCHGKQAGWQRSWHARALARPSPTTLVANFHGAHFRGDSSEAWMDDRGGPTMRTVGADGAVGSYPVEWLVGGKRMQDTLTVLPDGRWQILPVYYHVTGRAWVDYTEDKQGRLGPEHPFFWQNFRRTANRECLDCHATGVEVGWDEASGRFTTRFADAGVACEACHGPGAKHEASMSGADIFSFRRASPAAGLAVCASCHGPRNPLYPILDAAHRFQPGDAYGEHYQALVVVDGDQRSGDYFADGRPKTSSFEGQALAESRCARVGGATCLSCHAASHDAAAAPDELRAAPDETCRGCHAPVFAARRAHTQHARVGCVDCHMPKVVTGVLDRFADHALDVPAPENTVRHGVPSACGACHAHEKTPAAELAAAQARLWPHAAARTARRLRLADAFDEATARASEPALRAVLADADEAALVRGAAALLLGQRFPATAAGALAPLLGDADPLLRARAVEAVGYGKLRGLADAVAHAAGSDDVLSVRHMAVLVLGMLGDGRAAPAAARLTATPAGAGLPQPHFLLGLVGLRRGDLANARTELERTVALMPYHADARVALADLLARGGDVAGARRQLARALSFAPQHAAARARLAALPGRP
jgi:predicted CXXCH cytochrome family protein